MSWKNTVNWEFGNGLVIFIHRYDSGRVEAEAVKSKHKVKFTLGRLSVGQSLDEYKWLFLYAMMKEIWNCNVAKTLPWGKPKTFREFVGLLVANGMV